jgi:hypothetical protein
MSHYHLLLGREASSSGIVHPMSGGTTVAILPSSHCVLVLGPLDQVKH